MIPVTAVLCRDSRAVPRCLQPQAAPGEPHGQALAPSQPASPPVPGPLPRSCTHLHLLCVRREPCPSCPCAVPWGSAVLLLPCSEARSRSSFLLPPGCVWIVGKGGKEPDCSAPAQATDNWSCCLPGLRFDRLCCAGAPRGNGLFPGGLAARCCAGLGARGLLSQGGWAPLSALPGVPRGSSGQASALAREQPC